MPWLIFTHETITSVTRVQIKYGYCCSIDEGALLLVNR